MNTKHTSHRAPSDSSPVGSDSYRTVDKLVQTEIKIQGSRFISILRGIISAVEFEQWYHTIQKKYFDATHHCYAYRIGKDGLLFRFNDDGEPNGTAGKRILSILEGHHLVDVGLIVVRYFGGTKLGVGGLSRAYSDASETVISGADVRTKYLYSHFYVSFPAGVVSDIHRTIDQYGGKIISQMYDEKFRYLVQIRQSKDHELKEHLVDSTNGAAVITSPEASSDNAE